MKKVLTISIFIFISIYSIAQNCDSIVVNLKNGTINKLKPSASQDEVKAALPCSTGDTEDGSDFNCGGGVFFLDNDFFFYTGNDYIELREKFNGKLSTPVLGLKKNVAIAKLKMGKAIRTVKQQDGKEDLFFKTTYGCVRLQIEKGKVKILAIHGMPAKKVVLCL
jgi:hypothetical protein